MNGLLVFFAQVVTASTPLVLASLGGVLSERAGVATLTLEAYLLAGAFGAAVAALGTGSVWAAMAFALALGAALGALFAWSTVALRANAIISGVALNLLAAAGTRVALKVLYDSASNSPPLPVAMVRARGNAQGLGWTALLHALSTPLVWVTPLLVLGVHGLFSQSVLGLRITACGEHPMAARTQGINVETTRATALVLGAAVASLGGAQLCLQQQEFIAYMSGGRGFLALAAVILGRWQPVRAALCAVGIGALTALEATLAGHTQVPTALLQSLPFVLTLAAVASGRHGARPPAALG